ncbi:MFS transporter [Nocardioides sp.]|uniref:MFS transporter n=1 Tax=Nocardioides sp. TaxID=35761 RepID=UPI002607D630|nr:MFS transporter [Nocardioides sp.]
MTEAPAAPLSMSRLALVMAFGCGVVVANLYYCQPLLELISREFGVSEGTASLAVTLSQAGYAVGLLFLVPLGDLLENRALITRLLLLTALSLVAAGLSPSMGVFLAAAVLIGVTSVIVQVLVPLAAHLAPAGQEGAFVGKVMGGLMLGILLARSASAAVAEVADWRAIYLISAVMMVGLSLLLARTLPHWRPAGSVTYRATLRSLVPLIRAEPVLRRRTLAHAAMFGAFTVFWTGIAFELVDEHHFSQGAIALFALAGAGGALAAPLAGRLADRGLGRPASLLMVVLVVVGFLLAGLGHSSVAALVVSALLIDFAVQGHQVIGQHVIYTLAPRARARVTTVYMTTVFLGGALASLAAGLAHTHGAWTSVCWLGGLLPLISLAAWVTGMRDPRGA